MLDERYHIDNLNAIDTPALAVYPELVSRNIRRAVAMVEPTEGTMLRPHVKTHKTKEVVQMMQQAGINRFKCSTIAEAEMLGLANAPDVLLAYQPTAVKAERLAHLREAFPDTRFSCLVDNLASATMLAERFAAAPLPVFIDLDVGMHRTGVAPSTAAALYRKCEQLPGLLPVGLHAYDGHIHAPSTKQRAQEVDAVYALVNAVRNELSPAQSDNLTLVMGGTPTFPFHARRTQVECSPGTFPFWDAGYAAAFPDLPFRWAVLLLTRVISVIDAHTICLDAGSKAVATDAAWPRLVFPDQPDAEVMSQYEEHLLVRVADTTGTAVGDVWRGVPLHICPTVNLYESLHVINNHRWEATWSVVARARTLTI